MGKYPAKRDTISVLLCGVFSYREGEGGAIRLRSYVVYDIMKTQITFAKIPGTKFEPAFEFIQQIGREAKTDPGMSQLFALIIRGMKFLQTYGLQEAFKQYFVTDLEDGRPYTIRIAKQLKGHVPLLEFRINLRPVGAFRVFFFEYDFKDRQILVFANGMLKQSTDDPAFEAMASQVDVMYANFLKQPEQYINLEGEGLV